MTRNIGRGTAVLISAVILLSFGAVPAAAKVNTDEEYGRAYSLLSYLGVLEGLEDPKERDNTDKSDTERIISRAEFAMCFAHMLNTDGSSSRVLYYNDLPATHFAFKEITLMTDNGYINGTDDKKFEPDVPMNKQHAIILMLKALGLASYINSGNADERVINWVLNDSEITDGVSGNEYVTFRDMVVLAYNTLIADYYEPNISKVNELGYKRRDGDSLLYESRKMRYVKKKLLSAANGADIYGIEDSKSIVVIGGIAYDSNGIDYSGLLGRRVDYVWLEDDADYVVWAAESGDPKELKITVDEDTEYNPQTGRLRYTVDNRERTVKLSTEAAIVYNGRYTGKGLENYVNKRHSLLTLLSSSGQGGDYDIILIESYQNLMVSDLETKDKIYAYDRDRTDGVSLDEEDYYILDLYDTDGNEIKWSDIKRNDILSVFISEDGQIAKVIQSNSMVSGKVENIDNDGDLIIDGKHYEVYSENVAQRVTLGSVINCYLDHKGYIAAVETGNIQSDQFVGFILSGAYDENEITNGIVLKILSEDGTIKSYNAAPKLNVDGKSFKSNEIAYAAISADGGTKGKPEQQIALIKLNEDGEVRRIDRAYPDDGEAHPLTINRQIEQDLASVNQAMYTSGQGKIGVNMLVDSNTKVFFVPQNLGGDYSRCGVGVPRIWDDYRGAVSYRTTQRDNFVEQYIVTRQITYGTIANTHPIRMVDRIYQALNGDGEAVWMLTCTDGNSFNEYEVSEYLELDKYNLHRGDIIRVATTATNNYKLEYLNIVSRAGDDTPVGEANRKMPYATGRVISGYANDKLDYYLKIGWDSGNDFDEIFKLTAATPMAVYDSQKDKVYTGTVEDIKTQVADTDASRVLVQTHEGTLQRVFVYR